jgi:hypothetical protein
MNAGCHGALPRSGGTPDAGTVPSFVSIGRSGRRNRIDFQFWGRHVAVSFPAFPSFAPRPQKAGPGGRPGNGGLTSLAGVRILLQSNVASKVICSGEFSPELGGRGHRDGPSRAGPAGSGGGGSKLESFQLLDRAFPGSSGGSGFPFFRIGTVFRPGLQRSPTGPETDLVHRGRGLSFGSLGDLPGRSACDQDSTRNTSRRSLPRGMLFGSLAGWLSGE